MVRAHGYNYSIAVSVPSTNKSRRVSARTFQHRVIDMKKTMSRLFGGTTTVRAAGSYVMRNGRLVNEPVAIVQSYSSAKDYRDHRDDLERAVKRRKKSWRQESVAVTYETPRRPSETMVFF